MSPPEKVTASQVHFTRVGGYILRYLIRFVEIPYLTALAVSTVFMLLSLFGKIDWAIDWIFGLFLGPIIGFKNTFDPNFTFHTDRVEDIVVSAAFWLTLYHLFWEIGYLLTKKPFFRDGRVRDKSLFWLLIGVNALLVLSYTIEKMSLQESLFVFIFATIMTAVGLASLSFASWLRSFANLMILQTPESEEAVYQKFFGEIDAATLKAWRKEYE